MCDREEIKAIVIELMFIVSNRIIDPIEEGHELVSDLLLGSTLRRGLADSYTRISRYCGGKRVTQQEALGYKTVKDVVDGIEVKL